MTQQVSLVAIVEVEKSDRIVCQAPGCGHGVYRRIHILLIDGVFTLLGSACFKKHQSSWNMESEYPLYHWGEGRRLTAEERARLIQNTTDFIEQLETERQQHEQHAIPVCQTTTPTLPQPRPAATLRHQFLHPSNDASMFQYEGENVLCWRWCPDKQKADSLLKQYKAGPSYGAEVDRVAQHYEEMMGSKIPYMFALDVELKFFLPKNIILRALHELGLIEKD